MAKDKITEYDATANNNTVCGDVNIAENSALPSDMNNFAREIMSHLKEGLGSGTPLYVDQTNNRLGINTSSPTTDLDVDGNADISGTLTMGGNVDLQDNDKLILGTGNDLEIYHDGSHSYISDQGTGNIKILADDFIVKNSADTETMIQGFTDASVSLWYDNSQKLATTSSGVSVTGTVTATSFSGGGLGKIAQVQNVAKSDTFSTNTTSADGVAITGMQVNITPSATSSKVLVTVSLGAIGCSTSSSRTTTFQLYRGTTQIAEGNTDGSRPRVTFRSWMTSGDTNHALGGLSFSFLDSPSSTSALSYKLHMSGSHASDTFYLNRSGADSNGSNNYQSRTISTMQCMEILA